jgi:hypothetical protein
MVAMIGRKTSAIQPNIDTLLRVEQSIARGAIGQWVAFLCFFLWRSKERKRSVMKPNKDPNPLFDANQSAVSIKNQCNQRSIKLFLSFYLKLPKNILPLCRIIAFLKKNKQKNQ